MRPANFLFVSLVTIALVASACGSEVEQSSSGESSGSGSGGHGAAGSTVASAGHGASTGSSTSHGGTGGGTTGSGGGAADCDGLFEADCLAAYPDCAPLYDDSCCPTCTPGACADCQNLNFYECRPAAALCNGSDCGIVPDWVCTGGQPACPEIPPGGSTYECEATAGCVVATCSPDVNCALPECHAVTADSCTSNCNSIPPSCPAAQTAEQDGSCYTGYCIPAEVCGVF